MFFFPAEIFPASFTKELPPNSQDRINNNCYWVGLGLMTEFRGRFSCADASVRTIYQSVARRAFPSMKAFDATQASRRDTKGFGKMLGV